jgi:hypothetical protein
MKGKDIWEGNTKDELIQKLADNFNNKELYDFLQFYLSKKNKKMKIRYNDDKNKKLRMARDLINFIGEKEVKTILKDFDIK